MNKEELKPCPFCGCEAELVQEPLFGSDSMTEYYRIECTNRDCEMGKPDCLYDVSELDKSEIIKAWNTRTPTDEWISVEEDDKPEEYECHCINGFNDQLIGHLQESDLGGYECESNVEQLLNVTHWKPLPEPPKGGEKC